MRYLASLLTACFLLGTLPACEVLGGADDTVVARSIGSSLVVTNKTSARIYYFVVGRATAALINWAPHLDPENSVARGTSALVRHEHIFRSDDETEAIVFWWHAVERAGQLPAPGEIQAVVVGL